MTARSHYHGLLARVVQQTEQLEGAALDDALESFVARRLAAGELFAAAGERSTELAFVAHGLMRGFYRRADGSALDRAFYGEGSFALAPTAITRTDDNYFQIQAIEDTQLLVAEYSRLTAAMTRHHSLERLGRRLFERAWARRVRREAATSCLDPRSRYRLFIEEYGAISARLDAQHVASYLGVSPAELDALEGQGDLG